MAAVAIIGLIVVLAVAYVLLHDDRADRSLESTGEDAYVPSFGSMDAFPEVVSAPMPLISAGDVCASFSNHPQTAVCSIHRGDRPHTRLIDPFRKRSRDIHVRWSMVIRHPIMDRPILNNIIQQHTIIYKYQRRPSSSHGNTEGRSHHTRSRVDPQALVQSRRGPPGDQAPAQSRHEGACQAAGLRGDLLQAHHPAGGLHREVHRHPRGGQGQPRRPQQAVAPPEGLPPREVPQDPREDLLQEGGHEPPG